MSELKLLKILRDCATESIIIILAWIIVLCIFPVLTFFFTLKIIVLILAKIHRPELRPLHPIDSNFALDKIAANDHVELEWERNPLSNITLFVKLREPSIQINLNELEQRFKETIDKSSEFNWKLKSYWVRFCGFTFFQEIPNYKYSDNIRKVQLSPSVSVLDYLNTWSTQPYPLKSALWELLVLENESEGFLALKMHHGIGDGLSLFHILEQVLGLEQHPQVKQIVESPPRRFSVFEMLKVLVQLPAATLKSSIHICKASDPFKLTSGIGSEQRIGMTSLNLEEVKWISKVQGVDFNSVLAAIYSGALRKFLIKKGKCTQIANNFSLPVAKPWPGRPRNFIGNNFGTTVLIVPLNVSDPLQRLDIIYALTPHHSSSTNFLMNYMMHNFYGLFPDGLHLRLKRPAHHVRNVLSPLLAADEYTMYDGNSFESVFGLILGLGSPSFGIAVSTISFNGTLAWTILGSKTVFEEQEDLDLFTQIYILEEFDEILEAVISATKIRIN